MRTQDWVETFELYTDNQHLSSRRRASGVSLLIKMQDLAMQKLSEYSLLIGSILWLLVMAEMGCKSELLVGLHVWVKHLEIKKCLLSSASEVSGSNVNSCFILSIWCGIVHYFTSERLKWWFQTHIMADLCQEVRLISLWRMVGNAPLEQLSAWSIVKFSLQTHFGHVIG